MRRHMGRRYKSGIDKIILRSGFELDSSTDLPVKKYLTKYAINIVNKYEISNDLMKLILSLLEQDKQEDLIYYIYQGIEDKGKEYVEKETNFNRIIEYFQDYDFMSSRVVEDIYGSNLLVNKNRIINYIIGLLEDKLNKLNARSTGKVDEKILELMDIFDVDMEDITILIFLFCNYGLNDSLLDSITRDLNFQDFIKFISFAVSIPLSTIKKKLSMRGQLFSSGIIETIDVKRSDFFVIDDAIYEYLSGISDVSLLDRYIKKDRGSAIDISSFSIDTEKINIIQKLLLSDESCNIFLYGKAGTGKTEFTRSLAAGMERELYFVQFGEEKNSRRFSGRNSDIDDRIKAINIALNTVNKKKGIIVIDEADYILNTMPSFFSSRDSIEKGWLNSFLDSLDANIIWISNRSCRIEESTLRRFSYSLYFKDLNSKDRLSIWHNRLKGNSFNRYIPEKLLETFSNEFEVNAGAIASAVDTLKSVFKNAKPGKADVEKVLREVLERHEALIKGLEHKKNRGKLYDLTDKYDISALNIDGNKNNIINSIKSFSAMLKNEEVKDMNMNLLYWGLPGTGKTEFAKYLAKECEMKLLVKRYSDLESMYVGETEKNIAKAFREAEEKNAILFVDEADSFFTSRETANRSWEVSRTNEFLTQMENHRGILVCCTNLLPTMDMAAMRRFNFKIEFKPIKKNAKLVLYKKYFNLKGKRTTENQKQRIKDIPDLTPGDYKAVWQRCRYIPEAELKHSYIIEELEKEVRYKKADMIERVGF
ncbi:AAA family ATPase [Spirochaetota bacterium]